MVRSLELPSDAAWTDGVAKRDRPEAITRGQQVLVTMVCVSLRKRILVGTYRDRRLVEVRLWRAAPWATMWKSGK